jgi:hypothetical protein
MYPSFQFLRAINDSAQVKTAIDPTRHAERIGLAYRIYVVTHKTPAQWAASNTLTDVTGGFDIGTVTTGTIADNVKTVWSPPLDGGTAGTVGKGYDVVYDFGSNGALDPGDLIDGLNYKEAGVYAVRNLTLDGGHAVVETIYSGGSWLGQDLYYPSDIATMGQLPLVVISHGNGHNFQWYDYLGTHLASYGYIVMSHQNDTGGGPVQASSTTLTNTDYLLGNLGTIAGGALNGHVDNHKITWVGHSTGGEGVVLAFDRIFDGTYTPTHFVPNDITLIRAMAPTVFYSPAAPSGPDPHDRNFELICGWPTACPAALAATYETSESWSMRRDFLASGGAGAATSTAASPVVGPGPIPSWAATNNISKTFLRRTGMVHQGTPRRRTTDHLWDDQRSTGLITPRASRPASATNSGRGRDRDVIIDDYQ